MNKIELGAKLPLKPYITEGLPKKIKGEVVYINNEHHYFTAEFDTDGGKYWESFKFFKPHELLKKPHRWGRHGEHNALWDVNLYGY